MKNHTHTRTTRILLASLAVLAASTACSTTDSESGASTYCRGLTKASNDHRTVAVSDRSSVDDSVRTFHALAAQAPDDIGPEWATVDAAFYEFEGVLRQAGLSVDQVADTPARDSAHDPVGLRHAMSSLDLASTTTLEAAAAIEEHAVQTCGIGLVEG